MACCGRSVGGTFVLWGVESFAAFVAQLASFRLPFGRPAVRQHRYLAGLGRCFDEPQRRSGNLDLLIEFVRTPCGVAERIVEVRGAWGIGAGGDDP